MTSSYTPINPTIRDGRLAALEPLLGAQFCTPIPCDPNDEYNTKLHTYSASIEAAARLTYGAIFTLSGAYSDKAVIADFAVYKSGIASGDVTGRKISATHWGGCLRLSLRVSSMKADMALTLPVLAASVEMNAAHVQYELSSVGGGAVAFATALESVPVSGAFNYDVYARLNGQFQAITKAIREALAPASLLPIGVDLQDGIQFDLLREARDVRYAMALLAGGRSFPQARQAAPGFDAVLLNDVYRDIYAGADVNAAPGPELVNKAKVWIEGG